MPHENQSDETTFGYLSTVRTADHGYFGGYLIVSRLGRPLEFHCTSPVQPSRAQEILYGPTLEAYLIGEQIGGTLLKTAKLTPRLVLTDQESMLALRQQAGVLMARLLAGADDRPEAARDELRVIDEAGPAPDSQPATRLYSPLDRGQLTVGPHALQLPLGYESEESAVAELIGLLAPHVDLAEPFGRIQEAIREAQRIGGSAQDSHGQAA